MLFLAHIDLHTHAKGAENEGLFRTKDIDGLIDESEHGKNYLQRTPVFAQGRLTGHWFNLPAFLIIIVLSFVLSRGIRESAMANNIMVVVKVAAILIFVVGAARAVQVQNWHPFLPNGFSGVLTGSAIVFFTYIRFDSVSTTAEECKRPQRDIPFGIIVTLVVCAALYAGVALVLTGIADYKTLSNAAPVANAPKTLGFDNIRRIVGLGALFGIVSSLMVYTNTARRESGLQCRGTDCSRESSPKWIRFITRRSSVPGLRRLSSAFRPESGT